MAEISGHSLIDRAVVSVVDGEKVGAISDVHLDLAARTVLGFAIGGSTNPFHREAPQILPLHDVQSVGPHAVTVANTAQVLADQTLAPNISTLESVHKRVVTEGGEVIGDGNDIVFDTDTGAITGLQLAPQGGFLGVGATTRVLPVDDIVSFGRDVITVRSAAAVTR